MVKLQVYVADACWNCAEARRVVAAIRTSFPQVAVQIIDVLKSEHPGQVFAVPTYLLDGTVISLGNPSRDELEQALAAALAREEHP